MSSETFWLPKALPWDAPDHDETTLYAIRALAAGTANEGQQRRAWAYILYVSGIDDMEFRPEDKGGERASAFAGGKRFVGRMLQKLLLPIMTPKPPADPVPSRRRPGQRKGRKST